MLIYLWLSSSILKFLNLPEATIIDMLIFCLSASKWMASLPTARDSETFFLDFFYIMSTGCLHLKQINLLATLYTLAKNSILVSILAYRFEGIA